MPFDFRFRFAESLEDKGKLIKFLLQHPLGYPHYKDWVSRIREELSTEYKQSILAFSDGILVGDLVFQPHKDFSEYLLELKNMRIHPKLNRRYFGHFMLRQAETEARIAGYQAIICDMRTDNFRITNLLRLCGYHELLRVALYEDKEDIVMIKSLGKLEKGFFTPVTKKIIEKAF